MVGRKRGLEAKNLIFYQVSLVNTGLGFPCGEWCCPKRPPTRMYLEMKVEGGKGEGVRDAFMHQRMYEQKRLVVRAQRSRET